MKLVYDSSLQAFDLVLDGTDLAAETTLGTAVMLSLTCDRMAQPHEVARGQDRRGWWADAFTDGDLFGSRLWLLVREKQLPAVVQRCKAYIEEALQWMIDDNLVRAVTAAVFSPGAGRLVAVIKLALNDDSHDFRFEWNDTAQIWQLDSHAV